MGNDEEPDGCSMCRSDVASSSMEEKSQPAGQKRKRPEFESDTCSICWEPLRPPQEGQKPGEDSVLTLQLQCGHAYHGFSCLGPHISSVRSQVKNRVRAHLGQQDADMELQEDTQFNLLGGRRLGELHARGKLRQCPRCRYGPVINMDCSDMGSHDATRGSGQGRSTNECPNCGFYSPIWEQWSVWDPEDWIAAVRCPICRGPCKPVEEEATRIQAHLEKMMPCAHRIRTKRLELFEVGSQIVGVLNLVSALSALGVSGSSTAQLRPRHDFHRFPLVLADMARCPGQAGAILQPLLERIFQAIQVPTMPVTDVGSESKPDCPASPEKVRMAIAAISELLPLEAKYERVYERKDFRLCMAIAEELKTTLDTIICPLASHNASLDANLRILHWTESGFRVVPSLDKLLLVLKSQLEASLPIILCDVAVQTDDISVEPIEAFNQLALIAQNSFDAVGNAADNDILESMFALLGRAPYRQTLDSIDRLGHAWPAWQLEEQTRVRQMYGLELLSSVRRWKDHIDDEGNLARVRLNVIQCLRQEVAFLIGPFCMGPIHLHDAGLDLGLDFVRALGSFQEKLISSTTEAEATAIPALVHQYAQLLMRGLLTFSASVLSASDVERRCGVCAAQWDG